MVIQLSRIRYIFLLGLIVVVHLSMVFTQVVAPFPVTRLPSGDKYTYVKDKGVVCNNNNSPLPGAQCTCPNGETLLMNKEGARCHSSQDISIFYQNWYKDMNSVPPGPRILLHQDANIVSFILWDATAKKWKTPPNIFDSAGKILDPSVCSSAPVVDSAHCNTGSLALKPCLGLVPSYFVITLVTNQLNNRKHFAFKIEKAIEADHTILKGHLMILKIKCDGTTASPLAGYLIMKFEGTKSYELGGTPQPPPQPQPSGSGDGDGDEGKELSIQRKANADIWTTKSCEKCACSSIASSYMVNKYGSASCYDRMDISISYGGQNIMELDRDPVYFFSFNDNIDKWQNPKTSSLYYFNSTNKVNEANCELSRIMGISVFNYNKWQQWHSVDYFDIEKYATGYTILINKAYSSNYEAFKGQLLQLQLKCVKKPQTLVLFAKFSGEYEYSSKTPAIPEPKTKTEPKSDSKTAIIIGSVLGGLGFICGVIALVCFVLRRRRRRRPSSFSHKNEKKEKEDLKANLKHLGNDDQVVMSKSDLLQFAETILQEKRSYTDSPRYVRPPVPEVDPRPKIGPLSDNYNPDDYNNDSFYSKIKEPKDDPHYEGLYLKPQDDSYIDGNAINLPKNTEQPINNNSAYEVEEEDSSECETVE